MAKDPSGSEEHEHEIPEAAGEGVNENAFSFGPPTESIVAQEVEGGDSALPGESSGTGGDPSSENRTLADAVGIPSGDIREPEATISDADPLSTESPAPTEAIAAVNNAGAAEIPVQAPDPGHGSTTRDAAQGNASFFPAAEGFGGGAAPVESGKRRRRRWPWITALVVALLAGGYVGAGYYFADRVPSGTTIAGIKLGGLDRDNAIKQLDEGIGDQLTTPVQVVATKGGDPVTVNPADYSLGIDKEATLDSVVGFSLDPTRLWAHLTGGKVVDPVLTHDDEQLTALVQDLAKKADTTPVDAKLAFEGTKPTVTPATLGSKLDIEETQKVLSTQILSLDQPIELPAESVDPAITTETAENAVAELAEPLVSEKVSVMVNEQLVEITPEQLAAAASFSADGDKLVLAMDGGSLGDEVRKAIPDAFKAGVDARIEIANHTTPTVVPSEDGIGIDDAELAKKVGDVGVTTDRTVEVETTSVPAEFTTEDANAMGIKEVISSIETPLTDDSVRTINLEVGTQTITNTLVKPDETFSLTEALGPIDAEHGFVSSGVVSNGFNSEAMGGGLSQLSTNTFNIGYLAGLTDVEHQPHSKYFERYPMGREATLWDGSIDMRWKNNTPYGVVIDTWVAGGEVHSQLWSTKYWDVETDTSAPYAYVQAGTKNNPAADCVPSNYTEPGFTVTVSRTISHDGVVNEEDSGSYNWTYQPTHAVTCN